MCLIAVAPKGTQKYSEFFLDGIRQAATTNTDGIGYTFKRDAEKSRVWISKGFKDVEKFIKALKNKRLRDNDELIVHLRIGNKGAKSIEMNHPFVLSSIQEEILTNDTYIKGSTMCHNGTLFDYSKHNSDFSDTYFFVKDFMSVPEIQNFLKRDSKQFAVVFKEILKTSRFAFLWNGNYPLTTLGEFKEKDGYYFSNESYKKRVFNVGGVEYDYDSPEYWNRMNNNHSVSNHNSFSNFRNRNQNAIEAANKKWDSDDFAIEAEEKEELYKQRPKSITLVNGVKLRNYRGAFDLDDKCDIVPEANCKSIWDQKTFVQYYRCFSNSIYVPKEYKTSQFQECKFVPQQFNYKHFVFTFTKACKTIPNSKLDEMYVIRDFGDLNDKNPQHCLRVLSDEVSDWRGDIYVEPDDLISNFSMKPISGLYKIYYDVFKLMKNTIGATKINYGLAGQLIRECIVKEQTDKITYRNTTGINLIALKIYHNYIACSLFDDEVSKKFTHTVQDIKYVSERAELVN